MCHLHFVTSCHCETGLFCGAASIMPPIINPARRSPFQPPNERAAKDSPGRSPARPHPAPRIMDLIARTGVVFGSGRAGNVPLTRGARRVSDSRRAFAMGRIAPLRTKTSDGSNSLKTSSHLCPLLVSTSPEIKAPVKKVHRWKESKVRASDHSQNIF